MRNRDKYNRNVFCWFPPYKGIKWLFLSDDILQKIANEYFEKEIYQMGDNELKRRRERKSQS